MADPVTTQTRKLQRSELERIFQDPRSIKSFENAFADITETLPTAIDGANDAAEVADVKAVAADVKAQSAMDLAQLAALSPVSVTQMPAGDVSPPIVME